MYHPERLLHALDGKLASRFTQEKALLLSRMGKHEEVCFPILFFSVLSYCFLKVIPLLGFGDFFV